MLAEKREVKILLFLFCRNLGEEGGSVVEFPSKKTHGYIQSFLLF